MSQPVQIGTLEVDERLAPLVLDLESAHAHVADTEIRGDGWVVVEFFDTAHAAALMEVGIDIYPEALCDRLWKLSASLSVSSGEGCDCGHRHVDIRIGVKFPLAHLDKVSAVLHSNMRKGAPLGEHEPQVEELEAIFALPTRDESR
ncbi:hypothetical protein E3_0910 [Rhodococcus phage E3]|uniref:hypothetical protein n=1 Tax=Rhodococcus phage E3 TaxID=1007869 RepID=UPI0002C6A34A|nr:hypothetical protein M176_gp096 [Rhodococcus phage E3]AEQ21005.1 hypothetical protein E3_0910 [Rhodococcus phage E3]